MDAPAPWWMVLAFAVAVLCVLMILMATGADIFSGERI